MRPSPVFFAALRGRSRALAYWSAGTTGISLFIVHVFPAIRDSEAAQRILARFPAAMLALLGIDPLLFTTAIGFLQAQLYTLLAPLLLVSFAIGAGADATAGEEEAGTLDLLLSLPLRRERVLLEKFLAFALRALVPVLCLVAVLFLGNATLGLGLPARGIWGLNLGLWLLALLFGAVAMAFGAWLGSRRRAAGAAAALALAFFFVNTLATMAPVLEMPARLSPFRWYLFGFPLRDGPIPGHLRLAVATAAVLVLAVVAFRRRDLRSVAPRTRNRTRRRTAGVTARPAEGALSGRLLSSVYGKALWDRRRSFGWWFLGLGGITALTIAFWPTIRDGQRDLEGILKLFPKEVFTAFGIDDPAILLTPAGFLSARIYASLGTVILLAFTIGFGTAAIAGEDERGTIDLVLSTPVRRGRFVLAKFLAMATLTALLVLGLVVILVAGDAIFELNLSLTGILAANAGLALVALCHGALAMAVGAATGRTASARGVAIAVALAGFVLNGLGASVAAIAPFRVVSPFHWYLGAGPPLSRGPSPELLLAVVATAALVAAAWVLFGRRELRT